MPHPPPRPLARASRPPLAALALLALSLLPRLSAPARAEDTWTNLRPGVDLLHRVTGGGTPQDIWAVKVDLERPEVSLRASMDERGTERAVVNSTFARDVGALAAINGDWSNGVTPVGLAIGNGFLWKQHYNNRDTGSRWGFFGCDVFNNCELDALPVRDEVPWFKPQLPPYRFYNAVGGNGVLLLKDGARRNGCYDGCAGDTCRHPRSAVCYDQERRFLWLIAVDGRRSGASGMQCREMRALVESLGCYDAMMLDGGGSTTLWANGSVRNRPADGSQRSVANHLAVIYTPTPDPQCQLPSGAWCEGSRLRTCTGGKLVNDGDCASFGAACGEDGDWAFCVDTRCPGGDGLGRACLDGARLAVCVDGQYGEQPCPAGQVCGTDAAGGGCMDPAC
ncbi:MAG: phosphodiester glycosidase family protein, partial [Deltaproteobacteria bacterium]|nr:phosphodiester glycosidase family protein [Deltaproteobacteria bacterium]